MKVNCKFIQQRVLAFKPALSGLAAAFKKEQAIQVHYLATLFVGIAGLVFRLPLEHILLLAGSCFLVIMAELLNTAIEKLCDRTTKHYDETIKYIKDISAAAVLCSLGIAICAGLYVCFKTISKI